MLTVSIFSRFFYEKILAKILKTLYHLIMTLIKITLIFLTFATGFLLLCFLVYFWTQLIKLPTVPETVVDLISLDTVPPLSQTQETVQTAPKTVPDAPTTVSFDKPLQLLSTPPKTVQETKKLIVPEVIPIEQSVAPTIVPVTNKDPQIITITIPDQVPVCEVPFCRGEYSENINNYQI
jgi:cytoskeletal protein RodZ